MKTQRYAVSIILMVSLFIGACVSTEQMMDNGNYEQLIALAQRRLKGKKEKKEKFVLALEEAFKKIQARDMAQINRLQTSDRPEDWELIYNTAKQIETRQEALRPFLPLVANTGYVAGFEFIRTAVILDDAAEKITSLYYNRAEDLLQRAELGNKVLAREAYADYQSLARYDRYYKNVSERLNHARDLGTARVQIRFENHSPVQLPVDLEEELLSLDFDRLNRNWVSFYTTETAGVVFDYIADIRIQQIQVTPDAVHEHEVLKSKEIEEGWEYVLDDKGNVAKDSLGNDIKRPRYIVVKAHVIETLQEKHASIRGKIRLMDARTGVLQESEPFSVDASFRHQARTFFGDPRALSKSEATVILPVPFPASFEMIMLAVEALKPELLREIDRFNLT